MLWSVKGTLSEAERHIIQQRMSQGRLNKAKRGELFNHAPIGYVRLLSDLTRYMQIPKPTLYNWIRRGFVNAEQLPGVQGPWIIWADADEQDRLRRLHRCSRKLLL